ncbi:cytoskeleton-associated protein 2-like [Haliotis cracherodii]|uniref:cytoskeleton-associated protein 2-like n=1 Tax=Haliotis cracherodii TaxID=6455 RepID=UPI0039E974AB
MQREELENKSKRELYLAKYEQWKKEKENLKCVKPLREKNTHNKTLQKKKDRNVKEVIKEVEKKSDAAQHKPSVKNEKQTVNGDGPNREDRSEGVVQQDEPCGGTQPHTVEATCPVAMDTDQVTLPEPVPLETHEFDPPKPVHIETNVPKTQDQLTMRDRLSYWKMNRKGTDETKNITKTRVMKRPSIHSAPNSVQKKEVSSKLHIIPKRLERRATFSVPTSKPLPGTRAGPSHRGMVRPSQTNENVKKVAPKVAKVSVRKPVLVVGAPKQRSQPGSTMRKALPHTDIKRHSLGTRRRLSAGMSKRPVGILKRKSCVPALAVKSETDIKTPSSSVETASSCGQSHVKFLTPSQTPAQQHAAFRKTPVKTKDACSSDSMRQKLNSWLEAKGKTPSKFRHLMCFDAAMSERKKQDSQMKRSITVEELSLQQKKMAKEDNVCQNLTSLFEAAAVEDKKRRCSQAVEKSVIEQLDAILQEYHHLVESGCPTDTLLPWLQSIYDNIPQARHYTPFYRCKVDTVKRHGCPADTIEVMAQAISNSAQPPSDLAALHTSIVTEMVTMATNQAVIIDTAEQGGPEGAGRTGQDTVEDMTSQDDNDGVLDELKQTKHVETEDGAVEDMTSPDDNDGVFDELKQTKRVRAEESAVEAPFSIHYCVANVTPFKKRKRAASISTPQPTQSVVTPVRRSTRRSVQNNVTDSEKIIRSISDLSEQEKTTALFRPNHALDDVLEKFS